jgi:hypothetical protein
MTAPSGVSVDENGGIVVLPNGAAFIVGGGEQTAILHRSSQVGRESGRRLILHRNLWRSPSRARSRVLLLNVLVISGASTLLLVTEQKLRVFLSREKGVEELMRRALRGEADKAHILESIVLLS